MPPQKEPAENAGCHRDRPSELDDLLKRMEQQLDAYVLQQPKTDQDGLKERASIAIINYFDRVRMRHARQTPAGSSAA